MGFNSAFKGLTNTHTQALGRTFPDEGSARRRDRCLTTHYIQKTAMSQAGFEPAIPASQEPQTEQQSGTVGGLFLKQTKNNFIRFV
jgi:hypothetical protein